MHCSVSSDTYRLGRETPSGRAGGLSPAAGLGQTNSAGGHKALPYRTGSRH